MNASAKQITVVIPYYNGDAHIEDALGSVAGQTRPPAETIIVDDGSSEPSAAYLESLGAKYAFRLIRQANSGQGGARNTGFENAKTELVALLDQDDLWYPRHLEALLAAGDWEADFGWVYSNADAIFEDGSFFQYSFLDTFKKVSHPKRSLIECLERDMFVVPSGSLVSVEAHRKVGGFDPRLKGYEDDDFFTRCFAAGFRNAYLREATFKWRLHKSSTSYGAMMLRSKATYARKIFERYPDDPALRIYLSSDYIAPRFVADLYREYKHAVRQEDWASVDAVLDYLAEFGVRLPRRRSRRVLRATALLRAPMARVLSRSPTGAALARAVLKHAIGRQIIDRDRIRERRGDGKD